MTATGAIATVRKRWSGVCKGRLAMNENGWQHKGIDLCALNDDETECLSVAWFRLGEDADAWLAGRSDALRMADALETATAALSWYVDETRGKLQPIGGMRAREALAAIDAALNGVQE